jgi:predicted nucleotidyltransferase
MVAYLRLLPVLGLLLADGARVAAQGSHGIAHGKEDWTKGESSFIPGAYIVEFEDGHVSCFSNISDFYLDKPSLSRSDPVVKYRKKHHCLATSGGTALLRPSD